MLKKNASQDAQSGKQLGSEHLTLSADLSRYLTPEQFLKEIYDHILRTGTDMGKIS